MLPRPFERYIPEFFIRDGKLTALSSKTDTHLDEWTEDVFCLEKIIDPVMMPEYLLDDVGTYLNAGLLNTDTERIKRQKIWNAVKNHRFRGTWVFDVKPTIDIIIGGDSQIFGSADNSDFILLGQEEGDPDFFWGTMGIDGINDELGIDLVGDGTELTATGIILIDIDLPTGTTDNKNTTDGQEKNTTDAQVKAVVTFDISNLIFALEDKIPTYLRVILGTIIAGEFTPLPNGQIN